MCIKAYEKHENQQNAMKSSENIRNTIDNHKNATQRNENNDNHQNSIGNHEKQRTGTIATNKNTKPSQINRNSKFFLKLI